MEKETGFTLVVPSFANEILLGSEDQIAIFVGQ